LIDSFIGDDIKPFCSLAHACTPLFGGQPDGGLESVPTPPVGAPINAASVAQRTDIDARAT
jgi:hypothetical protein